MDTRDIAPEHTQPNGAGQLKVEGNAASGVVDTVFVDGQNNRWTVPGRVVDAGGRAVVVMVFTKPASMTDDQFKQGMKLIEEEFSVLKKILEQP